jgi:hypothetical protein
VARLQNDRDFGDLFHTKILPQRDDKSAAGSLRLGDGVRIGAQRRAKRPAFSLFTRLNMGSERPVVVLPAHQVLPTAPNLKQGSSELPPRFGGVDHHVDIAPLGGPPGR